ncbi:MAG: aminoacyl-tRNA hydrolase [Gudongella sp.]|nr:aminoacyl-tRNA hydrolase [Gudongella sp.]
MIVVAGLGNPGTKYSSTRHNVGFDVVDVLANKFGIKLNKIKFKGLVGEGIWAGEKIVLIKPSTYMNLSGESIRPVMDFYKLKPEELIVVVDDIDIEFGTIKIKKKGSAGTHNGLKSILLQTGTDQFPRVKIGIGRKPENYDLADFVLSKFSKSERQIIDKAILNAADAIDELISNGIDSAMNKFNIKTPAQD